MHQAPDAAELEQVFEQGSHGVGRGIDLVHVVADSIRIAGLDILVQQAEKTLDRDQRRLQVV